MLDADATEVLGILVTHARPPRPGERDHRGYPLLNAEELARFSSLPKDRLEWAVAQLAELGLAGPDYASPHAPYRFGTVLLTPAGETAHQASTRSSPVDVAPQRTPQPPPPASRTFWGQYGRPIVIGIAVTVIGGLLLAWLL